MDEPLRFTGNWFIDAGILGFVNLMEEVYGWDLEELQRRVKEEPEKVYYGYFPLAYFYNLPQSNKDKRVLSQAIKDIESFEGNKHELVELVWWKYITKLFTDSWVKKKLGVMHEKDLKNKSGKLKDSYNDDGYVELVKKREELLNVALKIEDKSSKKNCGELVGKLIGKKKTIETDLHRLNLKDFEKLLELFSESSSQLNKLPKECKTKIQEAIEVHRQLKNYLHSRWDSLKDVPSRKVNTKELKGKSKYFRIPIDSGFYKNFMFFNNSKGIFEQLEDLKNLIDGNAEYTDYLQKIDKTLSKFLPSDVEFPNVHYTPIRVEPLLQYVPWLFVYLLNFLNAFTFVSGVGNIFFYGSILEFTYHVNKRLNILIAQAQEKQSMFKITWQAIIDTIVEGNAKWSLENMYLIQFSGINQQNLVDVEYIGIPKLHASIILDDQIREAINTSLPLGDSNVWLLGEFIKQKPLYPLISKHVWNGIKNSDSIEWRASLYALAIDSKLRKEGTPGAIFDQAFFDRPKRAAVEVKDFYKEMIYVATVIKEISPEISEKNLIHPLFSALRRHNRNAFVNTLLKALLQAKSKDKVATINNYLFRRILNNDTSWEDFALALIVGLIGGGEDVGSGQGVVED